jgi:hypothetical protein
MRNEYPPDGWCANFLLVTLRYVFVLVPLKEIVILEIVDLSAVVMWLIPAQCVSISGGETSAGKN